MKLALLLFIDIVDIYTFFMQVTTGCFERTYAVSIPRLICITDFHSIIIDIPVFIHYHRDRHNEWGDILNY
jgi:hypothetical protein